MTRTDKITLLDVARAAGVSRATASNVFAHPDRVRAELRERVEWAARDLGYAGPDPKGRLLRDGRFNALGVVPPAGFGVRDALRNPSFHLFLAGVAEVCDEAGASLVVTPDPTEHPGVRTALVDGLILGRVEHMEELDAARLRRLPFAVVDFDPGPEIASVRVDARGGCRMAAEHLLALGHRRFAILSFLRDFGPTRVHPPAPNRPAEIAGMPIDREKMDGYAEALAAAGIPIDAVPVVQAHPWAVDAAGLLLDMAPEATAVLSMSAMQGVEAIAEAGRRGLAVPRDLSVVGFNDIPEAAACRPALTTVDGMNAEKGRAATRMVLDGASPRTVVLPTRLVVRASTGPAPR